MSELPNDEIDLVDLNLGIWDDVFSKTSVIIRHFVLRQNTQTAH